MRFRSTALKVLPVANQTSRDSSAAARRASHSGSGSTSLLTSATRSVRQASTPQFTARLNPRFAPGWEHLLWTVSSQRDTAAVARVLRTLADFATAKGFRINPDLMGFYDAVNSLVAAGGNWAPALLTRDAHFVVATHGAAPSEFIGFGFLSYSGFPRGQVKFNDAILALEPSRAFQAILWMGKGFAYAARGDWD